MRSKICFSNIFGILGKLSLSPQRAADEARRCAKAFAADIRRAADEGCGIYFSNALIGFSSLNSRFRLQWMGILMDAVRRECALATSGNGVMAILGYRDLSDRDCVAVVSSGEVILDTPDVANAPRIAVSEADASVSSSVEVTASAPCEVFSISFLPISRLVRASAAAEGSVAVFVIGDCPSRSGALGALRERMTAVSDEICASVFFAQENSGLDFDKDAHERMELSINANEPWGDCHGFVEFSSIAYQKRVFGASLPSIQAETRIARMMPFESGRIDGASATSSADSGAKFCVNDGAAGGAAREAARLPLVELEGDGLIGAFDSVAVNLANKARAIGSRKLILGLSGGVDSAAALLTCARAAKMLGWSSEDVVCVSMPCFGTSKQTERNARELAGFFKVSFMRLPIGETVLSHFRDISHDASVLDKVFENAQARIRAVTLFDLANKMSGLQVGTSDLSEAVLGWCTFQGDQAAMSNVNLSFSKTQLKAILEHCAREYGAQPLIDVLRVPISPELLPPDADGNPAQRTEDSTGPYEVVDSFIFHYFLKGLPLEKCRERVARDFKGEHSAEDIARWCERSAKAYHASSFKRLAAMPGPLVTRISRFMARLVETSAFPL